MKFQVAYWYASDMIWRALAIHVNLTQKVILYFQAIRLADRYIIYNVCDDVPVHIRTTGNVTEKTVSCVYIHSGPARGGDGVDLLNEELVTDEGTEHATYTTEEQGPGGGPQEHTALDQQTGNT